MYLSWKFSMLYDMFFFFFKQKTAYEMRISDWSSDVCSSDLVDLLVILPFWVNQLDMLPRDWYLVLEMLTLFKLARYAPGLALLAAVLRSQARALVASFLTLGVLVTLSSSVMYVLEHEATPQLFTSIRHRPWWGVITLTTEKGRA